MNVFEGAPFSLEPARKQQLLETAVDGLSLRHAQACPPYRRLCERAFGSQHLGEPLEQRPFVHVSLFKQRRLLSVPEAEVFKWVRSSGTSGQPSEIALDRPTAERQAEALRSVLGAILPARRAPLLVIDSEQVLRSPGPMVARAAGLVGVMPFGFDPLFALDQNLEPRTDEIRAWLSRHRDAPALFVFGFTSLVWQHFVQPLSQLGLELGRATLVHGGGWKKLEQHAVSRVDFRRALGEHFDLHRVHDYYGLVEQLGAIHLECAEGVLHTPSFAEVVVRDPLTLAPIGVGVEGVLQFISALPESYPGHSVLTEDLGTLVLKDGCRCGRRGSAFLVKGRAPRASPRGCSDTLVSA